MPHATHTCWAVEHHAINRLDGDRRWLSGQPNGTTRTLLFATRDAARKHVEKTHGYLRNRPDLQAEPHGWRMPRVVKVRVAVEVVD